MTAFVNGEPLMTTTEQRTEYDRELHELRRMMAETTRYYAEARKADSEAHKTARESFWYPLVVAAGLLGSGSAFTFLIIELTKRYLVQ